MIRWLLDKFAVRPLFREDPYFKLHVEERVADDRVCVKLTVIRSSASWRGKFKVEGRADYPLETQVPSDYEQDGEYFTLSQNLSEKTGVSIEFKATPLQTGSGKVQFWLERKVGIGGQIAIVGTVFGQGDQEAIRKNKEYVAKNWNRWLEDNPDWCADECQ